MSRRAFTLLELLLAMAVGSMALGGGFTLVTMCERMDRGFTARLETTNKLSFVQRTIARSLQSIVVAPPDYHPQAAADALARALEDAERRRQRREDDLDPPAIDPADAVADESGGITEREIPDVPPAKPRFRMGAVLNEEGEPDRSARNVRRLELLLHRPPFGERTHLGPIRGALDLVQTDMRGDGRWRLQWTPIVPEGKPTILLEDLTLAEWSATDSRGQFVEFDAYEQTELPWAVRTIFWTEAGVKVDWMFDLGAASTTGDPL